QVHLQELDLETESRIILFTDGIYEEFNPEMEIYGEERLSSFILKNGQESPSSFSKRLISEVKHFTRGKPFQDDVTVLVLNINMDRLK
ncbi:MAG TPA: PP2C family protein-serine/threonine phosphatase, partial [Leptospiraceae bacterium]|nr:PP2C family protein-serine/threonine phosphatase [Leptospiraceae bacterium]